VKNLFYQSANSSTPNSLLSMIHGEALQTSFCSATVQSNLLPFLKSLHYLRAEITKSEQNNPE
jgi:hypothetical protein